MLKRWIFNEKVQCKILFEVIKEEFIAALSFSKSLAAKYVSLNNQPCIVKSTLIDLNPDEPRIELYYHPFLVTLDRYDGSCNTKFWIEQKM